MPKRISCVSIKACSFKVRNLVIFSIPSSIRAG